MLVNVALHTMHGVWNNMLWIGYHNKQRSDCYDSVKLLTYFSFFLFLFRPRRVVSNNKKTKRFSLISFTIRTQRPLYSAIHVAVFSFQVQTISIFLLMGSFHCFICCYFCPFKLSIRINANKNNVLFYFLCGWLAGWLTG